MPAVVVGKRGLAGGVIWPGWQGRPVGVLGLTFYLFAFSLAYVALDAGANALILFGAVQITMLAGAFLAGDAVPRLRWAGAGMAFAGLLAFVVGNGGDFVAAPCPFVGSGGDRFRTVFAGRMSGRRSLGKHGCKLCTQRSLGIGRRSGAWLDAGGGDRAGGGAGRGVRGGRRWRS